MAVTACRGLEGEGTEAIGPKRQDQFDYARLRDFMMATGVILIKLSRLAYNLIHTKTSTPP